MGPRNQRRLVAVAAVVIGAVAFVLLSRSPNHPGTALLPRPAQPSVPAATGTLSFGMTPQQVRSLTGKPTKAQGACWLFKPSSTGMVGSISVRSSYSRGPYNPRTTGDLKLCFLGGVYSYAFLREFRPHQHDWVWAGWPVDIAYG